MQKESTKEKPSIDSIWSSLDATKQKQLVDIIQHQFNIELLLKRKEMMIIKQRLHQTQKIAQELREQWPRCKSNEADTSLVFFSDMII
jgi:hypothetical protein